MKRFNRIGVLTHLNTILIEVETLRTRLGSESEEVREKHHKRIVAAVYNIAQHVDSDS